jgi:hypothetical protein
MARGENADRQTEGRVQRAGTTANDGAADGKAKRADVDPRQKAARKRAKQIRDFYGHLSVYVVIIGFLFILNLVTGDGWWFYWPALGWGIGIAMHAMAVYGPGSWFNDQWEDRKVREWTGETPKAGAHPEAAPAPVDGAMREVINQGVTKISEVRRTALGITAPAVRQQALRICASADNVLAALADGDKDPRIARDFLTRYLDPAQTILTQYVRLSSRGIASARPALDRVETHDLPLIEGKMDELYERIHRGNVIDLQVASEMLEMGLPGISASSDRATT